MARQLVPEESVNYFDLEDPVSLARLEEPMTALRRLEGLVGAPQNRDCMGRFCHRADFAQSASRPGLVLGNSPRG
jgi:hypothetical protein